MSFVPAQPDNMPPLNADAVRVLRNEVGVGLELAATVVKVRAHFLSLR